MIEGALTQLEKLLRSTMLDTSWLDGAAERFALADNPGRLLAMLSPQVRFALGDEPLAAPIMLDTPHGPLSTEHWSIEDAGRLWLVMKAVANAAGHEDKLLLDYFRFCDDSEKVSLMRGIALLDGSDTYKTLALDSGRTNSQALFEALALHNPYPVSVYTEAEFNQLVLKGLFMDVGIQQIVGLRERANATLSRMCEDYCEERSAAGREFPPDIWLAIGPFPTERGESMLAEHLNHADTRQRYYAVHALLEHVGDDRRYRKMLTERLQAETDDSVKRLLNEALGADDGRATT